MGVNRFDKSLMSDARGATTKRSDPTGTDKSAPRPLRVALILYKDDLSIGGSLRVVEILAQSLNPARVEVHLIFAYGGPGPVASRATVPCHFLNARNSRDFIGWRRARRLFAELDPDVLHFHNPVYWLHFALVGMRAKKMRHMHGPYFVAEMGLVERFLLRCTRRLADSVVCISRGMREQVIQNGWGDPHRTWTVYNAIDCSAQAEAPSKQEARQTLNLPKNAKVLGVVCRLAWYKGCRDALRILAHLHPEWHLMFCGKGPMQEYLQDVAEQEHVGDRVHFAGWLDDMQVAYAAMDAFLFVSRLEPFGLAIAESMAARVPVFGLAGEGEYRDAYYPLVTADNSVFVDRVCPSDYNSPEPAAVLNELAQQINTYGKNPESWLPKIDRAQKWVAARFAGPVQAEAMTEAYELLVGRPTDSFR